MHNIRPLEIQHVQWSGSQAPPTTPKLMATHGRGVRFRERNVVHVSVDGDIPICMWAALKGLRRITCNHNNTKDMNFLYGDRLVGHMCGSRKIVGGNKIKI